MRKDVKPILPIVGKLESASMPLHYEVKSILQILYINELTVYFNAIF